VRIDRPEVGDGLSSVGLYSVLSAPIADRQSQGLPKISICKAESEFHVEDACFHQSNIRLGGVSTDPGHDERAEAGIVSCVGVSMHSIDRIF
jgi:hypothetical protein